MLILLLILFLSDSGQNHSLLKAQLNNQDNDEQYRKEPETTTTNDTLVEFQPNDTQDIEVIEPTELVDASPLSNKEKVQAMLEIKRNNPILYKALQRLKVKSRFNKNSRSEAVETKILSLAAAANRRQGAIEKRRIRESATAPPLPEVNFTDPVLVLHLSYERSGSTFIGDIFYK